MLAVSSGGGHWVQLQRLRPAFSGCDLIFVCSNPACAHDVADHRFYSVPDATRWNRVLMVVMALKLLMIMAWVRPDVVVSTGAAPGYFAVRLGRFFRARTVWLDSVANAEELSLSGRQIGTHADLWLTQWPHLATADGPSFEGSVL